MWNISNMMTIFARWTREIKSGIAMEKGIKQEGFFNQQIRLKCKEGTSKVLHLEHSFVWWWNLDTLESGSEIPGMFRNVVWRGTEKISRKDRVRNEVIQRVKVEKNIPLTVKRRETNWIGHMVRRDCLLKNIIEGSDGNTRKKTETATAWP